MDGGRVVDQIVEIHPPGHAARIGRHRIADGRHVVPRELQAWQERAQGASAMAEGDA